MASTDGTDSSDMSKGRNPTNIQGLDKIKKTGSTTLGNLFVHTSPEVLKAVFEDARKTSERLIKEAKALFKKHRKKLLQITGLPEDHLVLRGELENDDNYTMEKELRSTASEINESRRPDHKIDVEKILHAANFVLAYADSVEGLTTSITTIERGPFWDESLSSKLSSEEDDYRQAINNISEMNLDLNIHIKDFGQAFLED